MGKILVTGLLNIETTVKVPSFPIEYVPIQYNFHGIHSETSGSGFNISKALSILGDKVELLSIIGKDNVGSSVIQSLKMNHINTDHVLPLLESTPQSVVLYGESGKRQIYCDVKGIQEEVYDEKIFQQMMTKSDLIALGNVNFSRPFLKISKDAGKLIATHVHDLSDISDEFNMEFMKYANILFLSNENINTNIDDFVNELAAKYHNDIIVVGLGRKGALLYDRKEQFIGRFPAVKTRKIISTVGAGDSLFSAFLHFYSKTNNPYYSIKNAILFASYKIGTASSANGFLAEEQLEQYYPIIWR